MQVKRASVSVCWNMAEGASRQSNRINLQNTKYYDQQPEVTQKTTPFPINYSLFLSNNIIFSTILKVAGHTLIFCL